MSSASLKRSDFQLQALKAGAQKLWSAAYAVFSLGAI